MRLLVLFFLLEACVAFQDSPPSGAKCGIDTYGCRGLGSTYCCSYYGYCGTTKDYCSSSTGTPCKCDCTDTNKPCDSKGSTNDIVIDNTKPAPVNTKYYQTCTGPPKTTTDTQLSFISKVVLGAQEGWWDYGVLPSLTIAQAILESGWGKSGLSVGDCNNLFGIKQGTGWTGPTCFVTTTEYLSGTWYTIKDYFRAYSDMGGSLKDHALFLVQNSRYSKVIGEKDYKKACTEIKEAGYATAPTYTSSLINLIESYALWQYDDCCDYRSSTAAPKYGTKCKTEPEPQPEPQPDPKPDPEPDPKPDPGPDPQPEPEPEPEPDPDQYEVQAPDAHIDKEAVHSKNQDVESHNRTSVSLVVAFSAIGAVALAVTLFLAYYVH